jgi:hypothetical protein
MLMPEREGGHLTLTFFFVWSIIVANAVTVAVCFLFLRQLARITSARVTLLIPLILLMTYLGAFAEKNVFADLPIMLGFGALGWVMDRSGWPKAPLILGLVLGPLVENNLFLAVSSEGVAWLARPGVIGLGLVILGALGYAVLGRGPRRDGLPVPGEGSERAWRPTPVFAAALAVVFALALWQSRRWGWETRLFPFLVSAVGLPLALGQAGLDVRAARAVTAASPGAPAPAARPAVPATTRIWAWIVGYFLAIWWLGFSTAALVATALYLRIEGRDRWVMVAAVALATWVILEGLFVCGLHLPLPQGLVAEWFEDRGGLRLPRLPAC